MKQIYSRMLLLLAMVLVGGSAWANPGDEITSPDDVVSGKAYYIKGLYTSNKVVTACYYAPTEDNGNFKVSTAAVADIKSAMPITFTKVEGGWTLTTPNGFYVRPHTSNGQSYLVAEPVIMQLAEGKTKDGAAIKIGPYTSGSDNWYIQSNTSSAKIGGYKATQNDVTLIEAGEVAEVKLVSISLAGTPSVTNYYVGEAFSVSGISVSANYDDDSSVDVTSSASFKCDPSVFAEGGEISVKVTATYKDCTAEGTYTVNVEEPSSTGSVYEKVTSSLTDWSGKYLIVYQDENSAIAMNAALPTVDAVENTIPVSVTGNAIYGDEKVDAAAVTVGKIEGGYSIQIGNGNYIGIGGTSNGLSTNAKETNYQNQFAYNSDKECSEIYIENAEKMYLTYNSASNQARFRYYKSGGQKSIQLYKLVEEAPASYSLLITDAEYATFYDSENAYVMPDDCEGYVFTVTEGLELAYQAGETIPAGEPLVIYTIEPGYKTLVYTTSTEDTFKSADMNDLEGTDTETALEADDASYFYALTLDQNGKNVGFYWMNETGAAFTNGAHKAYLKAAKATTSAKSFVFGEATAIKTVTTASDAKIYDLTGREVKNPKPGIYVVNGAKKYIK